MPHTIEIIAKLIDAQIYHADPSQVINQLKPLSTASMDDLSFYEPTQTNLSKQDLQNSKAGVIITTEAFKDDCPHACLIVDKPKTSFVKVAALFEILFKPDQGIHPSAIIGKHCDIHLTAAIGAGVVIGDGVTIHAQAVVGANTVIGEQVVIQERSYIFPNVTIYPKVQIGRRVIIHSGTVMGAEGFGFVPDEKGVWHRLPQLGSVIIQDDVSIGAGCTIDCGTLSDTVIERGVKIDDQVHIAHNVVVGEHTIIAGYSAVAGSVTIGKHCMLGGAIRVSDNLSITDRVVLTAGSSVAKSITEPGMYGSGLPVAPMNKWRRILARIYQLDELAKRVIQLEKKNHE
jgi:UDP-3-O-[3-hydroxymyristoyl] glucosamine N-acyltransferase